MICADNETEDWQQSVCKRLPRLSTTRKRIWQVLIK